MQTIEEFEMGRQCMDLTNDKMYFPFIFNFYESIILKEMLKFKKLKEKKKR